MTKPFLGMRCPLSDCPTRVNPEISRAFVSKKQPEEHKRPRTYKPRKKKEDCLIRGSIYKNGHDYNVADLSRQLNIGRTVFLYWSRRITGKSNLSSLTNDEVMRVYNFIKNGEKKSLDSPVRVVSTIEIAKKVGVDYEVFRYYATKLTGKTKTKQLTKDEINIVCDYFKTNKVKRPAKRRK